MMTDGYDDDDDDYYVSDDPPVWFKIVASLVLFSPVIAGVAYAILK